MAPLFTIYCALYHDPYYGNGCASQCTASEWFAYQELVIIWARQNQVYGFNTSTAEGARLDETYVAGRRYCTAGITGAAAYLAAGSSGATTSPPPPSPPPPSPSPPPRPPPPPPPNVEVVVSITAAGSPEDFDTTERHSLLQAAARAFGFTTGAPPGSTVTITAASVNIRFVFPTDPTTAATIRSTANSFTSAAALQTAIVAQLTSPLAIESTGGSLAVTSAPTVAESQAPIVDADAGGNPCFPSEALVTMADGTPRRLDALRAGDAIVAARADGTLTTDAVSTLSLADADVQGTTFVVLTTASGRNLTLTPTHHVPIGDACCADLKQAKDVAVGETVYEAVSVSDAVRATQVQKIGTAIKPGLHSPVLSHGTMPIVNGVATSFDALHNVRLASYNAS